MVGKFSDFPIWSRQSASYSNNFLPGATTGLFAVSNNAPIASNAVVSSTTGVKILPIFVIGSRYYKIEVLSGESPNYVKVGYVYITASNLNITLQGPNPARSTYLAGGQMNLLPTVYKWNGYVCKFANCTGGKNHLSPGYYRIKFSALKHYAPIISKYDSDYDIVITPAFVLDTTAAPSVVPTYKPSVVPSTAWPSKKPVRVPTYKPKENGERHSSTTGLQSSSSVDGSTLDVATIAGVSVAVAVLLLLVIAYFCFYRNKIASRINSGMLKSSTLSQDDMKMEDMFSPDESVDEGTERFSQINVISKF